MWISSRARGEDPYTYGSRVKLKRSKIMCCSIMDLKKTFIRHALIYSHISPDVAL